MEQETKVTAKIPRSIYKRLQQVKLDNDFRTIAEAITYLLESKQNG